MAALVTELLNVYYCLKIRSPWASYPRQYVQTVGRWWFPAEMRGTDDFTKWQIHSCKWTRPYKPVDWKINLQEERVELWGVLSVLFRGSNPVEVSWPGSHGTPAALPRILWSPSGEEDVSGGKQHGHQNLSILLLTCKCSSNSRIAATFPHLSKYLDASASNIRLWPIMTKAIIANIEVQPRISLNTGREKPTWSNL